MRQIDRDARCSKLIEEIRCKSAQTLILGTVPVDNPVRKRGQTAASGTLLMPRIHKTVPFGSAVERDFLLTCRLDHPIVDIVSQPFSILYSHEGGPVRRYTPDFLIQRDLSIRPSQFSTGEGEHEWLIVEVKRVQDFLRSDKKDIIRLGAMNAWTAEAPNRASTFAFDTMFDSPLGQRLKYFGRLSSEPEDTLARKIPNLIKSGRCKTIREIEAVLTELGNTQSQARRSLHIAIARGWLGYSAVRLPIPTDIVECWHEVDRLQSKDGKTQR